MRREAMCGGMSAPMTTDIYLDLMAGLW
jgi:hypothetical protein